MQAGKRVCHHRCSQSNSGITLCHPGWHTCHLEQSHIQPVPIVGSKIRSVPGAGMWPCYYGRGHGSQRCVQLAQEPCLSAGLRGLPPALPQLGDVVVEGLEVGLSTQPSGFLFFWSLGSELPGTPLNPLVVWRRQVSW